MKALNKLYVEITNGRWIGRTSDVPQSEDSVEYIRKDYLLEWAKDELKLSKDVECVSEKSYEEGRQQVALNLIDKLNEI